MRRNSLLLILLMFYGGAAAQERYLSLLPDSVTVAIAGELSGEIAKRNLEFLARQHRMRGSRGFHTAAEHVAEQARAYGLEAVQIMQFPADGTIFYGTQKSRPPWDAEFAELWELRRVGTRWLPALRIASWEAMPVSLAQDSESGEATALLVDVGNGTHESDYAGKEVRGKLVLAAAQPGPVAALAVKKFGAAGIISYAQNQRTAWWKEDENLVRWGHLDTFADTPTFAFMISLKQARTFQERLAAGEEIRLHASVRAGKHEGGYEVVTATIPGGDAVLKEEEVAFSCHMDHQLPGANDNASGSVTILEVARTFAKLIREGKIPRPARTIRFFWPPEIEGTLALLNGRPELAARLKAVIHMDMVGGGPATKAIFHVTRGPASLPSVVNDIAQQVGEFVNSQSEAFASGQPADVPLFAPEGGKEALQAEFVAFTQGSDHEIYTEGSWRIPAVYLNDWPDRYIHTNFDSPANIDPTKLKRAGFIGAATAYILANLSAAQGPPLWALLKANSARRLAAMFALRARLAADEAGNLTRFFFWQERQIFASMGRFFEVPAALAEQSEAYFELLAKLAGGLPPASPAHGDGQIVYRRNHAIKGPIGTFGYNYFTDHYGSQRAAEIRLFSYRGARGTGSDYAYEILNFVDGKRTVQEIRDAVSAEFGPVPLDLVLEYLQALESIGMVHSGV